MPINVVIPTFVGILTGKNSFILDLSIHFLYMEGNITHYLIYIFSKSVLPLERM